jgi:hydroxypyruvate isomerase
MPKLSRRDFIARTAAAAAASALPVITSAQTSQPAAAPLPEKAISNGRIVQSVCLWSAKLPIERLAAVSVALGLKGIDLVGPKDWPILKKHGLLGTMTPSHTITKGLNRKENHAECLAAIRAAIEANVEAGYPNVICFSGNTHDGKGEPISLDEGMKNCAEAIKQVLPLLEEKKITLHMELLNSVKNHKDYMCDNTKWGVELCKSVGSDRFKLLFDIYHMGMMGEDVIAMIQQHHEYFGHYHTAGVPGRNEIDDTQTLKYPAIMKAILDTPYKDYVAHEFIPKHDPTTSLAQAAKICDV